MVKPSSSSSSFLRFDKKALLYGISAMSCSMLHCIFVSFYIDYFVRQNIMSTSKGGADGEGGHDATDNSKNNAASSTLNWFIVGQFVYAAWNALNDLGFGWLSDTSYKKVKGVVQKRFGSGNKKSDDTVSSSGGSSILKQLIPSFILRLFTQKTSVSRRRLSRVAIGGPLWAAAFAFLWYPTPFLYNISPALELSVKMIIYDGFFSYTTVSFRALLVDITTDGAQRELCNLYASIGHVIGSVGVMVASQLFEAAHQTGVGSASNMKKKPSLLETLLPDGLEDKVDVDFADVLSPSAAGTDSLLSPATIQQNLSTFRTFCLFWALAAAVGFILSATADGNKEVTLKASSEGLSSEAKRLVDDEENNNGNEESENKNHNEISFVSFVSQTIKRVGMITVLIVWFLQDYSCTFATNFFSLFLTLVAAPHISPYARSILLLVSFVIPHAITVIATPFIPTLGKKFLVSLYLGTRTIVGLVFLVLLYSLSSSSSSPSSSLSSQVTMLTASQTYALAVLLMLNRVLTEAVCRTQGLIISDVCDEDTIAFNRPASMAGAIHGLVNVVSRPSQSVSPVISCLYLASYGILMPTSSEGAGGGGEGEGKKTITVNGSIATAIPICKLLAATIIFTTIVMQFVWRMYYNLDGDYLKTIRMKMNMRTVGGSVEGRSVSPSAASVADHQQPSGDGVVSNAAHTNEWDANVTSRKAKPSSAAQII